jgi:hypothetical protein
MLTIYQIKANLCYYDPRNPNSPPEGGMSESCVCESCFRGTTPLAEELLRLLQIIEAYKEKLDQ